MSSLACRRRRGAPKGRAVDDRRTCCRASRSVSWSPPGAAASCRPSRSKHQDVYDRRLTVVGVRPTATSGPGRHEVADHRCRTPVGELPSPPHPCRRHRAPSARAPLRRSMLVSVRSVQVRTCPEHRTPLRPRGGEGKPLASASAPGARRHHLPPALQRRGKGLAPGGREVVARLRAAVGRSPPATPGSRAAVSPGDHPARGTVEVLCWSDVELWRCC